MKNIHKNSRRIENEVAIMNMSDCELVTAFFRRQICFSFVLLFLLGLKANPFLCLPQPF